MTRTVDPLDGGHTACRIPETVRCSVVSKARATLSDMSDVTTAPVVDLASHPRYRHADWDELDRLAHALDAVVDYLDPDSR
jgi:hypothetical protein